MNKNIIKILNYFSASIFLILFFTSCSTNIAKTVASKSPTNHKYLTGSTNFDSLVEELVEKQEPKIKEYIDSQEAVLVPDFVNVDRLRNRSKLGFLLSEQLKNSLLNKGVIVKAVELNRDFQLGVHGFNVLTRIQKDIKSKELSIRYAFVGTYSVTTESLIIFTKLVDLSTGNILSSASSETLVDDEIFDLERNTIQPNIRAPMVL
jgi:TolB-like protein